MTLKMHTPCDDGLCPYVDQFDGLCMCEWFCGADEPDDPPRADPEEVAEFLDFAEWLERR